jgi:hypothetical protein
LRVVGRQNSQLFAVLVDDANLTNADLIVDSERSCYGELPNKENKKWARRSDPTLRNQPVVPQMKTGSPLGIR